MARHLMKNLSAKSAGNEISSTFQRWSNLSRQNPKRIRWLIKEALVVQETDSKIEGGEETPMIEPKNVAYKEEDKLKISECLGQEIV